MPDPVALAAGGNGAPASAVGGRAVVASPSCPCCGNACPSWRRLIQCSNGPACFGEPPPVVEAWICSNVTCIDGTTLDAGMVIFLEQVCWRVQLEVGAPPDGATIISAPTRVQCVSGCADPVCPQGSLWLVGVPCSPAQPLAYICGVTVCGTYQTPGGCYKVDPSSGYIPGAAIPPGALTYAAVARFDSCCDCNVQNCDRHGLTLEDFPTDPDDAGCFPRSVIGKTCCCAVTVDEQGQRHSRGRVRQRKWTTTQTNRFGTTVVNTTITRIKAGSEQIDSDGCATYMMEAVVDGAAPFDLERKSFGCEKCGEWALRAPRYIRTEQGNQIISGNEGDTWMPYCRGLSLGDPQHFILCTNFASSYDCSRNTQDATYEYHNTDFAQVITTRFEWDSQVVYWEGANGCQGECASRVNGGAIVNGPDPLAGGQRGGCAGCQDGGL